MSGYEKIHDHIGNHAPMYHKIEYTQFGKHLGKLYKII